VRVPPFLHLPLPSPFPSLHVPSTNTHPPAWASKHITYGLFLSDQRILSDVETEITVLAGIMMQNLPRETAWHLRGTRRIGVSMEDTETLQQCVSCCQH
jgi:hypothetical protein